MKVLFIGDIVGRPGRRAVHQLLPDIIKNNAIDLVVANGENAAAGFGVTREVIDELFNCQIDILTSGNHIWDKREVIDFIDEYPTLLRPANFPPQVPGRGSLLTTAGGIQVGIINLVGRIFMPPADCPFRTAEREIEALKGKTKIIIVDFHAEATSEKIALGWFLDGRVSAVIGTHTHVQTADERILPNGTAYITDAGMTGPFDSVIGTRKELVIERFLTMMPNKFDVAKGDIRLQGVIIDLDEHTGQARFITRLTLNLFTGGQ